MTSGGKADDFVGTWLYGPRPSAYHIELIGENCTEFKQTLNCGRNVQGTLFFDGHWLQGDLLDDVGGSVGSLRLRRPDATETLRSVVSNFKFAGSTDWGPDTSAHEQAMITRDADGIAGEQIVPHQLGEMDGFSLSADAGEESGGIHGIVVEPIRTQEPILSEGDCADEDALARALSQIMEEDLLHGESVNDGDYKASAVAEELPKMMSLSLRLGGKMNDSSGWDRLWVQLERKGWQTEFGPKGDDKQIYYMPPNVLRRAPAKCRVDYFDSKKLVLRHLLGSKKLVIDVSSEDATAAAPRETKPRARLLAASTSVSRCRRRMIATPQGAE